MFEHVEGMCKRWILLPVPGTCIYLMNHEMVVYFFQRIRSTVDEKEQKQLLMDLDVVMRSNDCPFIVRFFGALFREVM